MLVPLKVESWIWYAVGVFLICCRILSRSLSFGTIKKLKVDDYIMVATLVPYTALLVNLNIVAITNSNLIPPNVNIHDFTQQDIDERIYGSKLVLVVEQMQCITVWSLKCCFLFLYYRLTLNLSAHIYVIILTFYIAATFVIMESLYLGVWCRPFHNYWAMPTPNTQCSTATHHLITNAVFNISSDIAMLLIALSLFIRSKLPWSRKIILCGIFSLGLFIVLAAVLNKYYSFTHPFGSQWTFWYIRESSTAMILANLPFTWTLLRRIFKLGSFNGEASTQRSVPYHSSRSARGRHVQMSPTHSRTIPKSNARRGSNKSGSKQDSHETSIDIENISRQESLPYGMSFADGLGPGGMVIPAADPLPLPKSVKKASFRDQGLFGRGDLELMLDPWDSDVEDDTPAPLQHSVSNYGARPRATSMASNRRSVRLTYPSPASSTGSPTSSKKLSRIRDEEAQYKIQQDVGASCRYYDRPLEWVSEQSEMGGVEEEGGRIVDTTELGDLNEPPSQRPFSIGAERKASMYSEQERLPNSRRRSSH